MKLSRSTRSIVALLTAMFLLLCQTATAAQACFMSPAQQDTTSTVAAAPCHTATPDSDIPPPQPVAATSCDASQAFAKTASVPIFPPADLPPLLIALYDPSVATRSSSLPHDYLHAVCSSPPYTVLHCRFLN